MPRPQRGCTRSATPSMTRTNSVERRFQSYSRSATLCPLAPIWRRNSSSASNFKIASVDSKITKVPGAGGVRPPRPPQSAGASRSGAPSTDSGVGTQNHDGPGPTQLACVRGGNEAATKHLHDIGISNIVDVRTAVVKKASSDRMRSPGPIPRRGFLAAKPALGRCIASDGNGDSLAARAGLRHPPFMPYPKDRSTPRAASSSPSGPTMIIVETP